MRRPARPLLWMLAAAAIGPHARAGYLHTTGDNPTLPSDGTRNYSRAADLYVNTAPYAATLVERGSCPWLWPALSAQGFAKRDDGAPGGYSGDHGWTVKFGTLEGGFVLRQYYTWADARGAVTVGEFTAAQQTARGFGGAVMGLTYEPKGADPTGESAEWLQVVRTNIDLDDAHKPYSLLDDGYRLFLDNFWDQHLATDGSGNPTYDGGYDPVNGKWVPRGFDANPTTFFDIPLQPLRHAGQPDVQFQVFLVTNDMARKTLTVYDGVWWGFTAVDTPEPGSWALLVIGCGVAAVVRPRPRRVGVGQSGPSGE